MSQASEQLAADLKVLAADAEELLKITAGQAGERITAARDRMQQSFAGLRPHLAQAQSVVTANARAAANVTDDAVRENPWAAMGVAAVVGLAVGLLIGRS